MMELITEERAFRVPVCAICRRRIVRGAAVIVLRTRHAFGLVTHAVTHTRCPLPTLALSIRRESGVA
jgi:hypothetical protein